MTPGHTETELSRSESGKLATSILQCLGLPRDLFRTSPLDRVEQTGLRQEKVIRGCLVEPEGVDCFAVQAHCAKRYLCPAKTPYGRRLMGNPSGRKTFELEVEFSDFSPSPLVNVQVKEASKEGFGQVFAWDAKNEKIVKIEEETLVFSKAEGMVAVPVFGRPDPESEKETGGILVLPAESVISDSQKVSQALKEVDLIGRFRQVQRENQDYAALEIKRGPQKLPVGRMIMEKLGLSRENWQVTYFNNNFWGLGGSYIDANACVLFSPIGPTGEVEKCFLLARSDKKGGIDLMPNPDNRVGASLVAVDQKPLTITLEFGDVRIRKREEINPDLTLSENRGRVGFKEVRMESHGIFQEVKLHKYCPGREFYGSIVFIPSFDARLGRWVLYVFDSIDLGVSQKPSERWGNLGVLPPDFKKPPEALPAGS